ncbi:hypothetical protein AMES_6659 [Amycolatopsis mediterranei S699]|uniref:Uncharacterized protein n=2 Tax=Amycolatopsis mediterranei TaxID=33910 RepID=A0A0H3DFP9_AMYMU|nr:hypothetical protein [Amycolatopsis mediterranei]ADJ48484.1 hypothetical protein AMED_6760 [Amycolatopsis mediterranei U32]AEK45408.1 hypothetical protein RAM_34675 [Amycolatopsis mediterranei S699]AFO80195.1 hypothetical protein AMES_6659 [Amycolatopsis mediterranei S699]AGT87323.1 hypothetical protein B737_6659 [Amycolatopsis mediterranei RB]KDO11001.1 hypothetical protein DV26_10770 [Amycolatopsis mediterranei]
MVLTHEGFGGLVLGAFPEISINLIAAAIGGTAVWLVTRTRRRLKLLRARRFWRSLCDRTPLIVIGAPDFEPLNKWEKSGMVGKGDILALVDIQNQLRELGFEGKIVETKEMNSGDRRKDLVLIGGPDGNSVTETMMRELDRVLSYEFTWNAGVGNAVIDRTTGSASAPQYDKVGNPTSDYGLIIRAVNPLAPKKSEIVILAGCWGFGTAAAAELLRDRKFLRQQRKSKHFETLVKTTVVGGAHYNAEAQGTREITHASAD